MIFTATEGRGGVWGWISFLWAGWVDSFWKEETVVLFYHKSFVSKKLDGQYKQQNEEWEKA